MSKLSPEKLVELKEAFVIFDKDNDQKINAVELFQVMRSLGFCPTKADEQSITHDIGGSNKLLNFDQTRDIIDRRAPPPESQQSILEAFRIFDKDGHGYVSAAELRHVLTNLGEKLHDEDVDELIREAEVSGDGNVSIDDLLDILMHQR